MIAAGTAVATIPQGRDRELRLVLVQDAHGPQVWLEQWHFGRSGPQRGSSIRLRLDDTDLLEAGFAAVRGRLQGWREGT